MRLITFGFLVILAVADATSAHARLPAKITFGDATLVLNGAGSRTKYLMEMYVAGLYLTKPSQDANAIIAADALMTIRLEITSGFVTQEKLVESLNEGFAKATTDKSENISREVESFRKLFASKIAKGDVFDLTYSPSHGVVVTKNGKKLGVVEGLAFKKALFGIWLSNNPVDKGLKKALLVGPRE